MNGMERKCEKGMQQTGGTRLSDTVEPNKLVFPPAICVYSRRARASTRARYCRRTGAGFRTLVRRSRLSVGSSPLATCLCLFLGPCAG